jgi:KipI family sensor histidine kinase inhibitor
VRILPAGPRALLVELSDRGAVSALHAEIGRRREQGWAPSLVDVVPAAQTILLDGLDDPAAATRDLLGWRVPPAPPRPSAPTTQIPVIYDGEDLEAVAALWKVEPGEVPLIHGAPIYTVDFCGFAPGFAYMSGLAEDLAVPRRVNPRSTVPSGSVALAGRYTSVYPRSSPGGWQLIGRTDAVMWDPCRQPAALLAPGMTVRFVDAAR